MNDKNRKICRLCLKIQCNNEFKLIEEITKRMFDMLLLKHNVDIHMGNVICKECAIKLQNSVAFKSSCLNTDKKILPFINSEADAKLVLKEEVELNNISEDQKICRFCKRLTEKDCYTYLQRENMFMVDMVQKCIPELNLRVTEELIICQTCLDSLQSFLNFIMDLLDVEEKIKDNVSWIEAQQKSGYVSDLTIKYEVNSKDVNVANMNEKDMGSERINVKNEIEGENQEFNIKQEEIEIKPEDNYSDSFQDTSQVILYGRYISESDPTSHVIIYKCNACPYESKDKLHLEGHIQTHDYNSQIMYKHEMFLCRGKTKSRATPQELTHQDPLAVKVFRCEICSHKTNRKGNLKLHMLTHQLPPDLRMYTCEQCSYATDQKRSLKQHMITHKSPSETKMYKCDKCQFQSKHQSSLERHILTHQNLSEVTTYKCERCLFQSKHEGSLIRHILTHQDPSEIKTYKCVRCSYESSQKDRLRRHMLIHLQPSEIKMYKCQTCSFETKRNDKLKRHELTHHDFSEVTAYKCERCSYKTKRKDNLKQHITHSHENPSQPTIYKCESCPYEAKYKRSFEKHMQKH